MLPSSHVLSLFITSRVQEKEFRFDYASRGDGALLAELTKYLHVLYDHVPRGIVVFFPSFSFLQLFVRHLHSSQQYSQLTKKKRLFVEEHGKDVFKEYSSYLAKEDAEASLFAVIGGKLSEGINFSDDLGRCIAIVGMPYPNKNDVVLKEKMRYLDKQKPGTGQEFYSNLCMKAVNQAIGRAFRHKDDWASVVFLDCRYAQSSIRQKLTSWIEKRGVPCSTGDAVATALDSFYNQFLCVVCLTKASFQLLLPCRPHRVHFLGLGSPLLKLGQRHVFHKNVHHFGGQAVLHSQRVLALHRLHHLRRVEQLLNLSVTKRTRHHLLRRQSARYTLYLGRGLRISQAFY